MVNSSGVQRPGRALKYSAILLVLALLAYGTFLIARSWRETKSDQASQLGTIADLSEVAIDTYFTQLEIGMQNLGADLLADANRKRPHKKPDLEPAFQLVSRFQKLHSELGNVILIRGDGQVLLTGTTRNSRNLPTLARDSAFLKIRGELLRGPAFAIGQPVVGTIDKTWVVAARYAVTGPSGKLAYIISANLPPNLLQHFWSESATPGITALGLIRDDGYLVSRYPEPDTASLDDAYGKPVRDAMFEYLRANKFPPRGQVEMRGKKNKVTDLRALRRLQHYPITLFVEMPMSGVKAAWWEDAHAPYFVMTLLLACVFAYYSVSRRRRRAWSMAQRREELRQHYEQALHERSPNEILMFDVDTLKLTYANDVALENTGYTLEQLQQKDLFFLQPELSVESFAKMVEPLHSGAQEAINYQTTQSRENGSAYPVEVTLQLMALDDDEKGFMAIINDITALREAEENIRAFNAPFERRASRRNKPSLQVIAI
ncbi:MAG TPA: PAS domain S-box protein [Gallionella sp.]|nr:PAS domain S-box protein [Gallionella sp.]